MWTCILIGNGWKWAEGEAGPFGDAERMEGWQMGTVRATGKRLPVQRYTCNLGVVPCDPALPSCMSMWGKMAECREHRLRSVREQGAMVKTSLSG